MKLSAIKVKRIYLPKEASDGYRILVDRMWPRGLSKERAAIDAWIKDIAPSNALRKWFGHKPERWLEFQRRYARELKEKKEIVRSLTDLIKKQKHVSLLFAASDELHNNAVALAKIISKEK